MNEEIKKSKNSFFEAFIWWKIDPIQLEKQVSEYASLKIYKSYRGIAALLIASRILLSELVLLIQWVPNNNFIISFLRRGFGLGGLLFYLLFSFLIFKGKKWAILVMMIIETVNSGFALFYSSSVGGGFWLMILFWWALFMKFLFAAYKVERLRKPNHDNKIGSTSPFWKKPINIAILITCIVAIAFFAILIIKEIQPKSNSEKQMECLRLGSDFARKRCLLIINNK